jgi:hypothetical protein
MTKIGNRDMSAERNINYVPVSTMIQYLLTVPVPQYVEVSRVLNILQTVDHVDYVRGAVNRPSQ